MKPSKQATCVASLAITSAPRWAAGALCALITNYVYRVFLLVSSAYTMGRQEAKYGNGTSRGEYRFLLRKLTDM